MVMMDALAQFMIMNQALENCAGGKSWSSDAVVPLAFSHTCLPEIYILIVTCHTLSFWLISTTLLDDENYSKPPFVVNAQTVPHVFGHLSYALFPPSRPIGMAYLCTGVGVWSHTSHGFERRRKNHKSTSISKLTECGHIMKYGFLLK